MADWTIFIVVQTDDGRRYEGEVGERSVRLMEYGITTGHHNLTEPLRDLEHFLLAIVMGELPGQTIPDED